MRMTAVLVLIMIAILGVTAYASRSGWGVPQPDKEPLSIREGSVRTDTGRVRTRYFFMGGGIEGEENPPCHSTRYDFNDDLLLPAVRTYLRIVERTLGCELA